MKILIIAFSAFLFASEADVFAHGIDLLAQTAPPSSTDWDACNVVLTAPSENSRGALPLGNGKIGVNAWVEPNGDLVFYIDSPDSFSEVCQLDKIGKVRVHFDPSPLVQEAAFKTVLDIRKGALSVDIGDTHLELFVDAKEPVIRVSGRSAQPRKITVSNEGWRNQRRVLTGQALISTYSMENAPKDIEVAEAADIKVPAAQAPNSIAWYHRNETSIVPFSLKLQALANASGSFDPLLHRTFGAWIEGKGFARQNDTSLTTNSTVTQFDLKIACPVFIADRATDWIKSAQDILAKAPSFDEARKETEAAWADFWNRSWVIAQIKPAPRSKLSVDALTCGYALTRYAFAAQGRGEFPIKFNGGIFTVEPDTAPNSPLSPDWRRWGDCFWYQNTRHMYHPMLMAGDFDLMSPFFAYYQRMIPLAESRSRIYYNAQGVYFPETTTIFGTYSNHNYGWKPKKNPGDIENPYIRHIWSPGLELTSIMLDYWDWTHDEKFAQQTLFPTARAVLEYFNTRFHRDANGHLVIEPTQSVESFRSGTVINDMPCVAGLHDVTSRLAALPENLVPAADRAFFAEMGNACPPIPTEESTLNGAPVRVLAVAETYGHQRGNVEHPALYAVWPFHLYGVGKPDLQLARDTYAVRGNKLDVGWGYDGSVAARLGMADEAARSLQVKLANSHKGFAFPATWGPNYDWLPDQNHGGNLLETTQLMLLQHVGKKILLFPAWPKTWDVKFKLHAPDNTIVEASFQNGKTQSITVTPQARAKDVIDCSTLDDAAIQRAVAQP